MAIYNFLWMTVHATSAFTDDIGKAHAEADRLFEGGATPIQVTRVNGTRWFVVGPSGSGMSYEMEHEHRQRMGSLVAWLARYRRADPDTQGEGYNPLHWHLVEHREDGDEVEIVDHGERYDRGNL